MPANEIHILDIGTVFEITVKDDTTVVDISSETTKNILFEKPSKEIVTQTGVFVTDGTDGKVKYTIVANDLDEEGTWRIQAHLVLSGGTWKSDIGTFKVFGNL